MLAVAVGILGIIVLTGNREPESRPVSAATTPGTLALNPDRLRDYQDRLRVLDDRARQALNEPRVEQPQRFGWYQEPAMSAAPDPLEAERKRREYESLFSSNVVLSRRPDGQRLNSNENAARWTRSVAPDDGIPPPPTIDQVADAVIRASSRYGQPTAPQTTAVTGASATDIGAPSSPQATLRPVATGPISSSGPLHPVLEGTLMDAVLTNRLDGSAAAPVNCLVTNPIYSHDGRFVLIPAGSLVLGETKAVQTFGDTRLAVYFNRLVMPDGRTYRLDQFMGLNDIGDAGLRDQVNQHYRSTFGASAAVGLISGLAQFLGTAGFNRGDGDRTVIIAGGVGDATSQATAQAMNRFLNRPPSITIREGHRVKVYVTSDFELPAYQPSAPGSRQVLAANR
jgi:type IV secretory pathway VirB10-like protein